MKRILFVVESLSGGGAEKVLSTILNLMDKSKFDITVLTVVKTGVYVDEIERNCRVISLLPDYSTIHRPIEKIMYRMKYRFIYSAPIQTVYKRFVKEQYDVEIGFVEGFSTKFVAASTNSISKKLCWLHIDMKNNPYADGYYKSLEEERETYLKFDSIIAVSNSVKKVFEEKFDIHEKIRVIYNPIESDSIQNLSKMPIPQVFDDCLNIITVGRLVNQKGFDRLLRAINDVRESGNEFHLRILGDGDDRKTLEDYIKSNGLEKNVTLLGFQKNPYPWVAKSDVFVCTSRAEGYSLAIAEAMMLNRPVISVDCAGPNELLDYGKYGLLIPNTDQCIEETMRKLIEGKIDLQRLAVVAQERKNFFEVDHILKKIEEELT